MSELKPCPLCGAQFLISQEPHDNGLVAGKFYIYHDYGPLESAARKCRIDVPGHFDTREDAITAWNTRASDARIAELEAEVERLSAGPKVRPLEWFQPEFRTLWVAYSLNVVYSVIPIVPFQGAETVWRWSGNDLNFSAPFPTSTPPNPPHRPTTRPASCPRWCSHEDQRWH